MDTHPITPEGHLVLSTELDFLWRTKRPQVTQAVSEAAALGDRSENAEYIYGKKQLREIDKRIRFLSKRLEVLRVVDQLPTDISRIYFGAWVRLFDETKQRETTLRLVGADEFDHHPAYISINAPLARALLGKQYDDEVTVQTPSGLLVFTVLLIQYGQAAPENPSP